MSEEKLPFYRRFWIYQRERFPMLAHGPLITAFTFSAASFSIICRNSEGFIAWDRFAVGTLTTLTLFFLLRIADEFKDQKTDAAHRPYLPVPRGLIKLSELKQLAFALIALMIALNAILMPAMLWLLVPALGFLAFMRYEFGLRTFLRDHPVWYMLSHMIVLPVIDFYATGLDWLHEGLTPPDGLLFFLAVSYMNGLVIEWGRKMRAPKDEEEGVETYSTLYGTGTAGVVWLLCLSTTLVLALAAAHFAGYQDVTWPILFVLFFLCALPAMRYLIKPAGGSATWIERAAGLWTLGMYLTLGGMPMIAKLISS